MNLEKSVLLMVSLFILTACTEANKIADIEAQNHFAWQKFMNGEEFDQIQNGMSYMDVIELAKGRGQKLNDTTYVWSHEGLLTYGFEVTFEDGKVIDKKVVERQGILTHGLPETVPAENGAPATEPSSEGVSETPVQSEVIDGSINEMAITH